LFPFFLFFLSLSSASFIMLIGTVLRRHYLPPSSAIVSIAGGAATEDFADPELIVFFSVCLEWCPYLLWYISLFCEVIQTLFAESRRSKPNAKRREREQRCRMNSKPKAFSDAAIQSEGKASCRRKKREGSMHGEDREHHQFHVQKALLHPSSYWVLLPPHISSSAYL
jgi:heme exporter protein D